MAKITLLDGTTPLNVDKSKISTSRLKCIESEGVMGLIESWASGEVKSADAQVWLLIQVISLLSQLQRSSVLSPLRPH